MKKVLIAFASISGNTEKMATIIKEVLIKHNLEVDMKRIEEMDVNIINNYDMILIGVYTRGNGDIPYETVSFYEELKKYDLTGVKASCFGSGDRTYIKFCFAIHHFESLLLECGAEICTDGLKVHLEPNLAEEIYECEIFAKKFLESACL